jgi:lipoate-protein ligase B
MSIPDRSPEELWVYDLGTVGYREALALQEDIRGRRQAGEVPDSLLLLEHSPVYTLGRRANPSELPLSREHLRSQGIEVHGSDRGGRVTYHGPGQLIAYPIFAVSDVVAYVRALEEAIVVALSRAGLAAHGRADDGPDYTGVWVQERKIASIGVHVQRGVTTHGLAVNVDNDLEPFSWITPCGLEGVQMTSLQRELGPGAPSTEVFRGLLLDGLCEVFGRTPERVARGSRRTPAVAA